MREHLFGKILRVDRVQPEAREPLALELEDFVNAARGLSRPRVSGDDALRAVRLADQILRCLETHRWDAEATPAATPPVEPRIRLARSAFLADQEHASKRQLVKPIGRMTDDSLSKWQIRLECTIGGWKYSAQGLAHVWGGAT